jgi:hypothetical protein
MGKVEQQQTALGPICEVSRADPKAEMSAVAVVSASSSPGLGGEQKKGFPLC